MPMEQGVYTFVSCMKCAFGKVMLTLSTKGSLSKNKERIFRKKETKNQKKNKKNIKRHFV